MSINIVFFVYFFN